MRELNLDFIGKIRVDADLRYLYTGEQKKLGAPRKYDGKFDGKDLSRLNFVKEIKPGVSISTLNASLTSLNLAKYQAYNCHSSSQPFVFSMANYKRLQLNRHLLSTFIDKLDLDPNLILNHPNFPSLLSYGTLAA